MSVFAIDHTFKTAHIVVGHDKAPEPTLPTDRDVIKFCYFCQQEGTLHKCTNHAHRAKRYVRLPDGTDQLVCGNHHHLIPTNKEVPMLSDEYSLPALFAKASA